MNKQYFIDVLLRGYPLGEVDTGDEPIITAIRVAVEFPEELTSADISVAIGEQVHDIGIHIVENNEEIASHIDRYEAAVEEVIENRKNSPDSCPN